LKAHEGVQVSLHLLFTSALGGVNWQLCTWWKNV
jgi:hypothetical protein